MTTGIEDYGKVIATGIDFEMYMQQYMDQHTEWYKGSVIEAMPISGTHYELATFLTALVSYYLRKTGEGKARGDRFTMRLSEDYAPEPDILVVTTPHLDRLQETRLNGPADLAIEIISTESMKRDRGFKFDEYEMGGVREYWIIDPIHQEAIFYVLDAQYLYQPVLPDTEGYYTSTVLPRLRLKVSLLFESPIPDVGRAVELVNQMLG
jgi:Uma2 family endonuclease